jgi:hypothetical protein
MLIVNPILPTADQAFLKKLQELDLELIAHQLMQSGWSHQQTSHAIMHYRMFLFLVYLHPNTKLVPTQEIDLVWHYHILHTRKYRKDCQMLFGRFIDHEPDFQLRSQADSQMLDTAFVQTQALFEQYFGQAAFGDTLWVQLDWLKVAEYQPQRQNDCEQAYLRHHRSACGRPSSVERDRSCQFTAFSVKG